VEHGQLTPPLVCAECRRSVDLIGRIMLVDGVGDQRIRFVCSYDCLAAWAIGEQAKVDKARA
jgi:hypothetical protein